MELMLSILAGVCLSAVVAGLIWYVAQQDGFPVDGRGPWLTFWDALRFPWAVLYVMAATVVCRLRRWAGLSAWRWNPVFCGVCWWGGRLGRCAAHDGSFWCRRCGEEL